MKALLRAASAAALIAGALAGHAHADVLDVDAPVAVSGVTVSGNAPSGAPVPLPVNAQSIGGEQISETVNAVTTEDALKYLGTVFVRRRHIGDTQAPITTRTSGVGSSARSLIYADGVLLSALIGNNNSTASPRWGMVAPEDIARVDLRFGPFSAAYPGNSIGAVVEITTKAPQGFEASGRADAGWQAFSAYGTQEDYRTYAGAVGIGDRTGPFSWRLGWTHVDTEAQPLTYVTATRPASPGAAGTPAFGAFDTLNRTGAAIVVIGAGGFEAQQLDTLRLRLGLDLPGGVKATYAAGYFGNQADSRAQTYLRDSAGNPLYSGSLNINGYAYTIAASAFSNGVYTYDEGHIFQGLTFQSADGGALSWRVIASTYDFDRDLQRLPSTALPAAATGGAGTIVDLSGTGWRTGDANLAWSGFTGQVWRAGVHWDRYTLSSHRYSTTDWRIGAAGALTTASEGQTETSALWIEDKFSIGHTADFTLGLRGERWRAFDGLNFSASPALNVTQPELSASRVSPKAVFEWRPQEAWTFSASVGEAYRFPTVSELYQAVTTGATLSTPNPNLNPEHATSGELSVQRDWPGGGYLRLALFTETIEDALISQTAPITPGSSTLVSYVQNIGATRADGAELSFSWPNALPSLDLSGAVTYVDARIVDNAVQPLTVGKRTPQVPRWRATLMATWRPVETFSFTAAARYSDRVYATIDNSDIVTHTYQGFDSYLVIDLRAVWKFDRRWSLSAGIDNVAGRNYILFHPFPQRSMLVELTYTY